MNRLVGPLQGRTPGGRCRQCRWRQPTSYPKFEPDRWNKDPYIRKTHNCYTYALNLIDRSNAKLCKKILNEVDIRRCPLAKPQPGIASGKFPNDDFNDFHYTCAKIEKRMYADNPKIKKLRKGQECPRGYYKIALIIEKDNRDCHFYRQDADGLWSHKNGPNKARRTDDYGRLIRNPENCRIRNNL